MKDLLRVLLTAKKRGTFLSTASFKVELDQFNRHDKELVLDWDTGAGEEWARFIHKDYGIVYMINTKIKIIFARKSYMNKIPIVLFNEFDIYMVENYDIVEWYIQLKELKEQLPEIDWHVSAEAVNDNKFSLNDFYFATI